MFCGLSNGELLSIDPTHLPLPQPKHKGGKAKASGGRHHKGLTALTSVPSQTIYFNPCMEV